MVIHGDINRNLLWSSKQVRVGHRMCPLLRKVYPRYSEMPERSSSHCLPVVLATTPRPGMLPGGSASNSYPRLTSEWWQVEGQLGSKIFQNMSRPIIIFNIFINLPNYIVHFEYGDIASVLRYLQESTPTHTHVRINMRPTSLTASQHGHSNWSIIRSLRRL